MKISNWTNNVVFYRHTVAYKTKFEGLNTIQTGASCNMCLVGLASYIGPNTSLYRTKIGRFCSIADGVKTGFGNHPTKGFVSTFPSFYYETQNLPFSFVGCNEVAYFDIWRCADDEKKYVVEVGNDVWIGSNVLIMDGVRIGDGAVIAAGAVVTKDVAPYSIVGGVPAHHIKYRFEEKQIKALLDFKWWEQSFDWIQKHYLDFHNIDAFLHVIDEN